MKKTFSFICMAMTLFVFAQVQDYPYIILSGEQDQAGTLSYEAKEIFTEKSYQVFHENQSEWSRELTLNPCSGLKSKVIGKAGNLQVDFYDCNQTKVASWKGTTMTEFYTWLPHQSARIPNYRENETKSIAVVTKIKEEDKYAVFRRNNNAPTQEEKVMIEASAEPFSTDGGLKMLKTNLPSGEFILSYPKTNEVYARFYPTKEQGVYHVKVVQRAGVSYYSTGFLKDNQVTLELQTGATSWKKLVFKKDN